ncbi:reverse transcriptase domain-containing protein [Tanacetum coccineum]|uniref:Reverse transcriptase domain-containing protein n=1 Tax=Tanacetum coccineum TaxID=301880 RepID=A0ABQ5HYG3_9ASTR
MFNSTLTGNARVWFDKLPKESIDSYEDLRTAFRENYLQQTKHIKDPVEIHHIKQRDGESTEDFMERYKAEVWTHHGRRKASSSWKPSEGGDKPTFKKGFKNKQRPDRKPDRFSLLTKTPKEIFALEKGKFKAPPPMSGQAKDYPELLFGDSNVFPRLSEEDETKSPMIIEVEMGGHFVHRVYIDGGASSEVLYEHCFVKLRKEIRDQMVPATTHLIGFSGETIWPLGRPGIRKIRAVPSTAHGMLKFPVEGGTWHRLNINRKKDAKNYFPCWKQNLDIFAWKPADMTGVPRNIAEHRLNIREGYSPVRQKKRGQAPERNKAIQEEVEKLVDAGIMKEVDVDTPVLKESYVKKEIIRVIQTIQTFEDNTEIEPKKCTFGMQEGMFLGYKVSTNGLKACPDKADAVLSFAISEMHQGQLLTLTAPREREELIIPWLPAKEATARSDDGQRRGNTVYFASKRLKRYFQAHTVVVITNQPIKQLLSSSEISGRMLKWKFELEGYDIQYRPRTAIKGQILADFIVERPEEESPDELMAEPEVLPEPWTLFTDGSSCVDGSGAGLILTNPEGAEFTYAMRFRFDATNNEAEYEALIAGLRIAEKMGIKNLQANVDSRLVANQVNGSYIAKESGMVQYLNKVKTLAKSFKEFSIKQIPRSENKKADALSKIASTSFAHLNKQVLVEELKEKSINEEEILDIVEEEGNTWMTPIQEYLTKEILPEDKKKARAVRRKAAKYAMINGTLYKKSFLGPWLRCVGPLQANYVLREIHEGSCSMHSGPRSVVAKVIQTGYYWPTMHMDARNLIRECNDCQIHRPVPRNPQQNLTPITSPWPFYKWGIDIAGPFPEGPGKVKFLIVAIDYFTKWIEAKAVATITGNQVKKFVWDNIVCRFGLPGEIISDNGKQFRDNPFKDWCEKLCIRQCFASVKHPQANGLVERANRSLGEGIKARLDERSRDWIEELPHVLWAHRTMIKSSNGETPFSLTYGTEAVIPAEIGMPTLRTAEIDQANNNEALGINLDLIEERREQAAIQEAKSKKKMEKYYNSRVRGTSFKPGEMVYRSNEASHAKDGGKLGPKWEGPYEVKESLGKGAYKLKDRKGNDMPRTWNIFILIVKTCMQGAMLHKNIIPYNKG